MANFSGKFSHFYDSKFIYDTDSLLMSVIGVGHSFIHINTTSFFGCQYFITATNKGIILVEKHYSFIHNQSNGGAKKESTESKSELFKCFLVDKIRINEIKSYISPYTNFNQPEYSLFINIIFTFVHKIDRNFFLPYFLLFFSRFDCRVSVVVLF